MWQWMIDEDKERLDDIVEEGTVDGESFEEFHKPWMGNKDDLPKDHWLYGFMESTLQSYEWSALHRIEILWSDETIYRVELSD